MLPSLARCGLLFASMLNRGPTEKVERTKLLPETSLLKMLPCLVVLPRPLPMLVSSTRTAVLMTLRRFSLLAVTLTSTLHPLGQGPR